MAKGGWSNSPLSFAVQIEDDTGVLFRDVCESVARDVIYKSPRDTSRFLANNNFSVNSPDESYDPNKRDPTRSDTLANARLAIAALKPGDIFYAVNTTPYGKYLEWGGSNQAPMGIYGIAANNARERGA